MSGKTVVWTSPDNTATAAGAAPSAGGLRERKKQLMRQQLSAAATLMFLERGFDAVRVAEIAAACGVSEKTVFNYFPTKESLLLDRFDDTMDALRTRLADPSVPSIVVAIEILDTELRGLTTWLAAQDDPVRAAADLARFRELSTSTAGLRAHQQDMMDRLTTTAAGIIAGHAGLSPDDPGPQIAATALLGLWRVQATSLVRHLAAAPPPAQLHTLVATDVARAAAIINPVFSALATPTDR